MTPTQIYNTIRDQAYETSTAFYGESEIYTYMWQAECEVAGLVECTHASTSTTTTTSTSMYTKPTGYIMLKRLTYDSVKLKKITLKDQDAMDAVSYGGSTSEGQPNSYYEWGDQVGLYPIPNQAKTLKWWGIAEPTLCSSSSTAFTVPSVFHQYIPDYCLYRMYTKDEDTQRAMFHKNLWDENINKAIHKWKRRMNSDHHQVVVMDEEYPSTDLGLS